MRNRAEIHNSQLAEHFGARFGRAPELVARSPGRVNLIGEHTDYNLGLVLPMAIDRQVKIWLAPRLDSVVNLYSVNFDSSTQFSLEETPKKDPGFSWADYVKGVCQYTSGRRPSTAGV